MDLPTKKTRPKRRVLHEEEYNRDGHWVRSFTVRTEVWPTIEHWATETGYRLTAMKSKKRTYQKGGSSAWYTTILELKQTENDFTMTAWIKVGFTARALSLFFHSREFQIDATGWKGSVVRRKTCAELNGLLERLKQAAIAESVGFHVSDLDSTTRALGALLLLPIAYFVSGSLKQLDPSPSLSTELFKLMGNSLAVLAILSIVLFSVHNFLIVKKFKKPLWKGISTGTVFILLSVLSAFLFSRASQEMTRNRFAHYCFKKNADSRCEQIKDNLGPGDKQWILDRMRDLEKDLTLKPK